MTLGRVAVLLATYNGARFLDAQLRSIHDQEDVAVDLYASDDGSRDETVLILKDWGNRWLKGKYEITQRAADRSGGVDEDEFASGLTNSNANFYSLIKNKRIDAPYFAFSDQDDVWKSHKLKKSVAWIRDQGDLPALYCSRTLVINHQGETLHPSLLFKRPPSFANAIIQNIAAGNTIVMNRAAMDAIRDHMEHGEFVSHDWWCYQVVTALGGRVHYDQEPLTLYRQHDQNLIGENASWKARMIRMKLVREGRFKRWNDINCKGLSKLKHKMPAQQRATLEGFVTSRSGGWLARTLGLARSGIHRQTLAGQTSLYVASLLGKI